MLIKITYQNTVTIEIVIVYTWRIINEFYKF